jgi:hypothetical protein
MPRVESDPLQLRLLSLVGDGVTTSEIVVAPKYLYPILILTYLCMW